MKLMQTDCHYATSIAILPRLSKLKDAGLHQMEYEVSANRSIMEVYLP